MKMEEHKYEINDTDIAGISKGKEVTSPNFKTNDKRIDIVRSIVDDNIIPKFSHGDNKTSNDIVQNIIEDVLVTNVINLDKNVSETRNTLSDSFQITECITDKNEEINNLSNDDIIDTHKSNTTKGMVSNCKSAEKTLSMNEPKQNDNAPLVELSTKSQSSKTTELVDLSSEEDKNTNSCSDENSDDETGMMLSQNSF